MHSFGLREIRLGSDLWGKGAGAVDGRRAVETKLARGTAAAATFFSALKRHFHGHRHLQAHHQIKSMSAQAGLEGGARKGVSV